MENLRKNIRNEVIKIKTAHELLEISKTKSTEQVAKILEGVREHIIERCEEEANKGATSYTIYLKKGLLVIKSLLLKECIKLVKEFENNGYKVSIEDNGDGSYYINFIMRFSWNGEFKNNTKSFGHTEILYTTNNVVRGRRNEIE